VNSIYYTFGVPASHHVITEFLFSDSDLFL